MYRKTQHSVYNITLHLVLVTNHGVEIIEWNHDIDHVHTILSIKPETNLNKYINASKAASSRLIKQEYINITKELWNGHFWTKGFYVNSTGSTQLDVVKNYILKQGKVK